MPRRAKMMAPSLTEETRSALAVLARSRTAPAHHVERSAIILHLADQRSASETAAALAIDRQRVTRCARRVAAVGPLEAIDDLPRSGRPPDLTEALAVLADWRGSVKYSCSGSPDMFWNGRTAMEGLSGRGSGLKLTSTTAALRMASASSRAA